MQIDNNVLKPDENITLIFGGFSAHPTHFLPFFPKNSIILYHYTHLDFTPLLEILHRLQNCKITLIAFSMGVFVARVFLEQHAILLQRKIAINGTEHGIHAQYGISPKLFKLTLKTFDLEVFKRNLFSEFLEKTRDFIFLDSTTLREELAFFIESCAQFPMQDSMERHWDCAIISKNDLIFSPRAQQAFWSDKTEIILLDAPHFAFFKWNL